MGAGSEEFVDERVSRLREGLFGMDPVDTKRADLRGWPVKERPW